MSYVSLWWRASRPFTFTMSVLPPIIGAIAVKIENPDVGLGWLKLVLTMIGCVLAHAGANMVGDYFDFKNRVDREGTFGSSGVLTGKLAEPKTILTGAIIVYIIASLIGIYLAFSIPNGKVLLWLILIGAVLGFFYTVKPFAFKYRALGDIAVFISFGPAMTLGTYYVQIQRFSWGPILYAIPFAFLVDAVLHSNNLRDIKNDAVVNVKTVAILIGERNAKFMYYGLVLSSYLSVIVLILANQLPLISLVTLLSLPLAIKLIRIVHAKEGQPERRFLMIDAATAQLHSAFGGLLLLSLLAQYLMQ
jgi:1,4-dihydroxy-2-naphthoate octaprenyltransferase